MTETVEYGLFQINDGVEHLVFTSEKYAEVQKRESQLPAVQETIIKERAVTKGPWE